MWSYIKLGSKGEEDEKVTTEKRGVGTRVMGQLQKGEREREGVRRGRGLCFSY